EPLLELDADQLAGRQEPAHDQGGCAGAATEIQDPFAADRLGVEVAEHFVPDRPLHVARILLAPDLVAHITTLGGVDLEYQLGRIGGGPRVAGTRTALPG